MKHKIGNSYFRAISRYFIEYILFWCYGTMSFDSIDKQHFRSGKDLLDKNCKNKLQINHNDIKQKLIRSPKPQFQTEQGISQAGLRRIQTNIEGHFGQIHRALTSGTGLMVADIALFIKNILLLEKES